MPTKPKAKAAPRPSHISAHSYDPGKRELTITFRNGRTYRYTDVPADRARGLETANSKGTYFHSQIRDRHPGTEITS